jgi:short-subunit dehydrogenase
MQDQHRLFDTNYWGVVYGSMEAVKRMKTRGGGAIINIGSELSERAAPLQGMYSASKHAVKGFTDALRMELEKEDAPISVTLVKPSAIDTMFTEHAKNYMEKEPALPPPLYAPELVADTILHAAQRPRRDAFVGGHARLIAASAHAMPRAMDRFMNALMFRQQKSPNASAPGRRDALYEPDPGQELRQRGNPSRRVVEHSPYTAVALHTRPLATALLGGGALLAAWGLTRRFAR